MMKCTRDVPPKGGRCIEAYTSATTRADRSRRKSGQVSLVHSQSPPEPRPTPMETRRLSAPVAWRPPTTMGLRRPNYRKHLIRQLSIRSASPDSRPIQADASSDGHGKVTPAGLSHPSSPLLSRRLFRHQSPLPYIRSALPINSEAEVARNHGTVITRRC
jgi:hypothetical protein